MPVDNQALARLMAQNNYHEALALLAGENLNGKRERFVRLQRAQLYLQTRQYRQAVEDCEPLTLLKDVRSDALMLAAEAHLNLSDYAAARLALQALYKARTKSPTLLQLALRYDYENENYRSVIARCEKLAGKKPHPKTLAYWVNALIAEKQFDSALSKIEQHKTIAAPAGLDTVGRALAKASEHSHASGGQPANLAQGLSLGVITPLGPGHEDNLQDCKQSLNSAIEAHQGRCFAQTRHFIIDDTAARLGRSRARNLALQQACDEGMDWIFFLDADDLLAEQALNLAATYLGTHDFIWGGIYSGPAGGPFHYRLNQIPFLQSQADYLEFSAFHSLQMGHFARLATIMENTLSFDETMDCGEDVKFYLQELAIGKAIKLTDALFYNIRGAHSRGPRAASGGDWNRATNALIDAARERLSQRDQD